MTENDNLFIGGQYNLTWLNLSKFPKFRNTLLSKSVLTNHLTSLMTEYLYSQL